MSDEDFDAQLVRIAAELRKPQEADVAPWLLALAGMMAGAALFAAGAAFMKVFGS